MPTIVPQSELHRRAVQWISEHRPEKCDAACLKKLLEEAAMRFNMSPLDAEFLQRFYAEDRSKVK
ncbi:hypothetical protein PCS_00491 [Desulfocurvibacter africanus PCS]|uniref:Uncharacterized protein n=1 Tax=Desulfocurvibacter africanus PCS TaxID=1262666 RepID=M5Q2X5_DESAF|nr:hypothetical protein [Desulfocurvibacter africanus]EMG38856.1 hypothetical protein PCS_00491 [Desulfocurvibacter africanus PCS]